MYVTWLIHVCDMTHSCVWHDSFMYVTWLIQICDMTHSCVWHDSFMYVTRLIHVCDMTHSCMWHDSFVYTDQPHHDSLIYETWLLHKCDSCMPRISTYTMTPSIWTYTLALSRANLLAARGNESRQHVWMNFFIQATCHIYKWVMLHVREYICTYMEMSHSYVWHDSFDMAYLCK